jgi:hypothetical protein
VLSLRDDSINTYYSEPGVRRRTSNGVRPADPVHYQLTALAARVQLPAGELTERTAAPWTKAAATRWMAAPLAEGAAVWRRTEDLLSVLGALLEVFKVDVVLR